MDTILWLKFFHLLLFAYWLGGDLGVFYASRAVVDSKLAPDTRRAAARVMLGIDQAPRICLVLMLPTGLHLASLLGLLPLPSFGIALLWIASLAWLALVLTLHLGKSLQAAALFAQIDLGLRIAVIAAAAVLALGSLAGAHWLRADWLAWKLLIFAAIVLCGIIVRLQLRPFGAALARLSREEKDADLVLRQSIARCRPFVFAIWGGLFANAALGLHLLNL